MDNICVNKKQLWDNTKQSWCNKKLFGSNKKQLFMDYLYFQYKRQKSSVNKKQYAWNKKQFWGNKKQSWRNKKQSLSNKKQFGCRFGVIKKQSRLPNNCFLFI